VGHEIVGFAGPTTTLQRLRGIWRDARIFRLTASSVLSFLPIPDDHTLQEEEAEGRIVPNNYAIDSDFSAPFVQHFSAYSVGSSLAWIRTNYYGSAGYQVAILWIGSAHVSGPHRQWHDDARKLPLSEWPINRALRGLGVKSTDRYGEFTAFGLVGYGQTEHIAAEAEELMTPG
jgi:hypothetical protein